MIPPAAEPILKLVGSYSRMDGQCWKLDRFCSESVVISCFGSASVAKTVLQEVFLDSAVRATGLAMSTWDAAFPDEPLPAVLPAAENWLRCRDEISANELASYQPALVALSLQYWKKCPGNPAWAGRGLAWICDAPKYGWPAFSAILALYLVCETKSLDKILQSSIETHR
ncbi:MAG: hypothetical protein JKY56_23085 [Kofleriaceae bacterium]|nr:hypothetical protein [Kofleriaceae bacterium]